jgi:PAS domain S-box-containing protein
MNSIALGWSSLAGFVLLFGFVLLYLYHKDHDKRKLMFTLGIMPGALTYLIYTLDTLDILMLNVLSDRLILWGSVPLIEFIFFIIIHQIFLKKIDIKIIFRGFLFFFIFSFIILISGIVTPIFFSISMLIGTIAIIASSLVLLIRDRNLSSAIFILVIITFTLAGLTSREFKEFPSDHTLIVPLFGYFMGYILLVIIFFVSRYAGESNGIGTYFVIKNKLKIVETALKESEGKYQMIVENTTDVIMLTNTDGSISYVSPSCESRFEYKPEELIGQKLRIVHPDDIESVEKIFSRDVQNKSLSTIQYRIQTKSGDTKWIYHTSTPIMKDKRVEMFLNVLRDVTDIKTLEKELNEKVTMLEGSERAALNIMDDLQQSQFVIEKQNAQLQKLDKIKSSFLNVTSHELRTPMSAIKGYIQMLLRGNLGAINEEQKNALGIVLRNSNRLDRLVQDILDISRLESGTMKFATGKTDVEKMINELDETMQASAGLKGIKINTEIERDISELNVDKDRISQVVINILNNAIKFSPEGSIINVRVKKQDDDVLFEVQDFGRGIPKEHHHKIFQTFYQVDSDADTKFGGAGLGLAICYGIIFAHGGRIWVESTGMPGEGSTFRFTLPMNSVSDIEKRFKGADVFGLGVSANEDEDPRVKGVLGEMDRLEMQASASPDLHVKVDSFVEASVIGRINNILDETQKKYLENAQFLSEIAIEFTQFPIEGDIYQYLGEKIQQITNGAYVTLANYDENTNKFRINKIFGYGKYMAKILQLVGKDPTGTEFNLDDQGIRQKLLGGKMLHLTSDDFNRFVLPQFPKGLSLIIDKIINMDEMYTVGLVRGGKLFGNVFVVAKNASKIENLELVEIFVNQAAVTIQRNNAIKEINELNKNLELQNVELQKLNEIKATFLKTTSHELRTPITAIKGYAQMLIKQSLGDTNNEQRKSLEIILRNTNRLDRVIQNILDVSNLQAGTLKFISDKVNPITLIEETTKMIQSFAYEKEMTINVNLEKDLPDLIVDGERIKQVMKNLMENAIKFSPDGSVVNICARKEKGDVLFEVQDFGQGIPKEKQEKIFETFYQVDSGDGRKYGGAGLSLALSRGIVVLHGGKMWVESTEGKGSTFRFTLPIKSIYDIENTDLNGKMYPSEGKNNGNINH